MADNDDILDEAADNFRFVAGFTFEDAEQHHLRYHLLRLTIAGLTQDDVKEVGELGRLAFQGSDVKAQAEKIKARADASPLAKVIADLVAVAGLVQGRARTWDVLFGAVLGAYTGLADVKGLDKAAVATLGAIGGAAALATSTFVQSEVDRQSWDEYLRMDS